MNGIGLTYDRILSDLAAAQLAAHSQRHERRHDYVQCRACFAAGVWICNLSLRVGGNDHARDRLNLMLGDRVSDLLV